MDITLRPARPEDAEEMARWFTDLVDLAAWGGPDVRFPLTNDQLAAWIAEGGNDAPRLCYTAVDERDGPLGHVEFLLDPPKQWARLGRFGIAPPLRGQGFGRALFEHAVRLAFTGFDVEHLVLAVVTANERAIRLYESCGFRNEGSPSVSRTAEGLDYAVNLMGLKRTDWIRLTRAKNNAVKVA